MSLMIEEQETHINFMRSDGRAEVYTTDTTMMTKLNKLIEPVGAEWRLERETTLNNTVIGRTYSCPISFISFRTKRVKRKLTEQQRLEIASRLSKSTSVCNFDRE